MADDRFFNLLKPIKEPKSSWDKIYDWVLGRARVVLLFVEILIVLIFFAKIIVDNIEKNRIQEFERLQLELLSLEDKHEDNFTEIQEKVFGYIELWDNSNNLYPILTEILDYIGDPTDQFSLVINEGGTVQINGYESLDKLRDIEADMKASEAFVNVAVDALSLEQSDVFEQKGRFSLTAFLDTENISRDPIR